MTSARRQPANLVVAVAVASALVLAACGEDPPTPETEVGAAPGAEASAPAPDVRAAALVEEAEAANNLGRTAEARRLLDQAEDLFDANGDRNGLAAVELGRAEIEGYLGQSDAARAAFALALDHFRAAGNYEGEAISLAALGDLEKATFRYAEARRAYRQARAAYDRAARPPGAEHVLLGLDRVAGADVPEARAWRDLDEAQLLYQQIDDPAGLGLVSEIAAALEERLERFGMAYTRYRDAAVLYTLAERPRDFARAQLRLGELETGQGVPLTARDALAVALETYRSLADDGGAAAALRGLGRLERILGRPAEARAAYREAAALFAAAGDDVGAVTAKLGAAEAARILADDDSAAEEDYRDVLAALEPHGPQDLAADANFGLGVLMLAGPEAPDASAPFLAAIEGYIAAGDRVGEGRARLGLAAAVREAGDSGQAAEEAGAARSIFAAAGNAVGEALALAVAATTSPDQEERLNAEAAAHLAAAADPLRDANQLVGLGTFGALSVRTADEGDNIGYEEPAPLPLEAEDSGPNEEILAAYPNANREAKEFLRQLRAQIGME